MKKREFRPEQLIAGPARVKQVLDDLRQDEAQDLVLAIAQLPPQKLQLVLRSLMAAGRAPYLANLFD